MKRISRMIICFVLLSIGFSRLPSVTAFADTNDSQSNGYSIFIQKYDIEDFKSVADSFPLDGTKAGPVTGSDGEALRPLAGISYEITRVTPMQGSTTFEPLQGEGSFKGTITTDANGVAQLNDLPQGMYQIVEIAHERLKDVMQPVIVELPFPQHTGKPLNEVWIYPKSSVTTRPDLPNTSTDKPGRERLPQTSGNIGTSQVLLLILGMIVVMGFVGMISIHRKKDVFN